MNWLTRRQIANAAATSKHAAIYCSMIHWNQILEAGPREFIKGCVDWGADYCAMCQMYQNSACPLNPDCCRLARICCLEYYDAVSAIRCYTEAWYNMPYEWNVFTKKAILILIERLRHVLSTL